MSGEPQYVGIESPKQIYGAWLVDATVVLCLSDLFLRVDPLSVIWKHSGSFVPVFASVGSIASMLVNGAILRGLSGGSVGDHIFRIARVNSTTWKPLGVVHAARYTLAPVYELFFHLKPEVSRFRTPSAVVATRLVGKHPAHSKLKVNR